MKNATHTLKGKASDVLPGPPKKPFFGNFLQLRTARKEFRFHHVLEKWAGEYGDVYQIGIFGKDYFIISDYEVAREILSRRPGDIRRRIVMEDAADEMGLNGLFTSDGKRWKTQRHLTIKALSSNYLEAFLPTLLRVTNRLVDKWDDMASTDKLIDVVDETKAYSADLMSNMVFGFDMNTLGLENKEEIIKNHFNRIFPQFYKRINSPFFSYWKYFKMPVDHKLHTSLKAIKKIFYEVTDQTRERFKEDPDDALHPKSMVEAMVLAKDEHDQPYSNEEIFANVFSVLLAGEDAVGNTIGWTLNFISDHPEVQKKIQEEVDEKLADGVAFEEYDFDYWNKNFKYIEAVLTESMRIKPIAPLASMQASRDVEINGVNYDKHATFLLLPKVFFNKEKHFFQADKFIPERWLIDKENKKDVSGCPFHQEGVHNEKAYMPFGHGPRYCAGSKLAMFEMKVLFAIICKKYEVNKKKPVKEVKEKLTLLMEPSNCFIELSSRN